MTVKKTVWKNGFPLNQEQSSKINIKNFTQRDLDGILFPFGGTDTEFWLWPLDYPLTTLTKFG